MGKITIRLKKSAQTIRQTRKTWCAQVVPTFVSVPWFCSRHSPRRRKVIVPLLWNHVARRLLAYRAFVVVFGVHKVRHQHKPRFAVVFLGAKPETFFHVVCRVGRVCDYDVVLWDRWRRNLLVKIFVPVVHVHKPQLVQPFDDRAVAVVWVVHSQGGPCFPQR